MYGGPWHRRYYDRMFIRRLHAIFLAAVFASAFAAMLWHETKLDAVLALAWIPVEAAFLYGFALASGACQDPRTGATTSSTIRRPQRAAASARRIDADERPPVTVACGAMRPPFARWSVSVPSDWRSERADQMGVRPDWLVGGGARPMR